MNDFDKLKEKTLHSREVFKGNLLHVFSDEVCLPNGNTSTREWISHPGAAAVVPLFKNGDTMLVKQFRYPLKQVMLEVPAGKIDAGESHEQTARRELQEETSLICNSLHYLGAFHPSIGYTNEVIHLYCGWDISRENGHSDEDEFLIKTTIPFREVLDHIYSGKITDSKTMLAILQTWHWWQQQGPFEI